MQLRGARARKEMTALAVLPNRDLALQLESALSANHSVHVLAELKSYPPAQTLDVRIRQLRPDVVLMDMSADPDRAVDLIQFVAAFRPPICVIALDVANHAQAILRAMRAGATEFLYAPFGADTQAEALERIRKMLQPEENGEVERGKLLVFTSAKPGSGASTLAAQTAFALERSSGKRILLADLDLWGGALAFFLKLRPRGSVLDAVRQLDRMGDSDWSRLVIEKDGVDVLPAPEMPVGRQVEPTQLTELLEFAQANYDFVIVDAPAIFEKLSLLALTGSDGAYVVTTAELPSLHLTRKAAALLLQLGFGPDRFRVLVNRVGRKDGISAEDMSKIFNAPVHATFPNDYSSLHQALAEGRAVSSSCALARAVEQFAAEIATQSSGERKRN